jgi:hypothetical protein
LCRVHVNHENRAAFDKFVQLSILDPEHRPWGGAVRTQLLRNDETGAASVFYFAKEGERLPKDIAD